MNFSGVVRINKVGVLVICGIIFVFLLYTFTRVGDDDARQVIKGDGNPRAAKVKRDPNRISLREILIAAVDVAQRGGSEVVKIRKSSPSELAEQLKGHTKEGAKDRVTQGDFSSHRIMYYGLRKAFPKIKVISEEHTENPDWADVPLPKEEDEEISRALFRDEVIPADAISVWIDPLDATQEYTENLVEYVTTMVCVAVKGVPVIGVIHRPFTKETYWAVVSHGKSPSLEIIMKRREENSKPPTAPIRIVVSRSHAGEVHNFTKSIFSNEPIEIVQAAGAGYKVMEVVSGRADVYLHITVIKKWDLCAGNAIMSALEGTMTTLSGEILDYTADTNPVNPKGLLVYLNPSSLIDKLKGIKIPK